MDDLTNWTEDGKPPLFSAKLPGLRLLHDSTSLTSMATCAQKYYRHMIQGVGRGKGSEHLVFGGALHAGLETFHNDRWEGKPGTFAQEDAIVSALTEIGWREVDGSWQQWISADKKKNPTGLLRALTWYTDDVNRGEGGDIETVTLNGAPATEVWWQAKLPFVAATGEDYWLCGWLDRLVKWDGEVWPLECKTTGSDLGKRYWEGWNPNIQIKTYDLGLSFAHPEWECARTLLEAHQIAQGFSRWARTPFRYAADTRGEWLGEIGRMLEAAEGWARLYAAKLEAGDDSYSIAFPQNFTACHGFGDGCPLRQVCRRPVAEREGLVGLTNGLWDPRMKAKRII